MESQGQRHIATAEDFFEVGRRDSAQEVPLPSGLVVELIRPSPSGAFSIIQCHMEKLRNLTEPRSGSSPGDAMNEYIEWLCWLLTWAFASPRFRKYPGADEIGLANLPKQDLRFIINWLSSISPEEVAAEPSQAASLLN